MTIELTKNGKIPYGTKFEVETIEEAAERVYEKLKDGDGRFSVKKRIYGENYQLYISDNKLVYKDHSTQHNFADAFDSYTQEYETSEVLSIVEARVIKEILEYEEADRARLKAEQKAEQIRKDAEKKAKYKAWKEEAERLDIPFRDLCDMKRAEMEENVYDDWD